jgi:Glycosyltransferase (GlcNAc)
MQAATSNMRNHSNHSNHSNNNGNRPVRRRSGSFLVQINSFTSTALIVVLLLFTLSTVYVYCGVSSTHDLGVEFINSITGSAPLRLYSYSPINLSTHGQRMKQQAKIATDHLESIDALQHTFPIAIGDDTEKIDHPGMMLVADKKKIPRGLPRTLTVPRHWDELKGSAYGHETIREYLGGGTRVPTLQEAMSIGSFDANGRETMFVSIVSFRDYDCRNTVENLYRRALYPERIRLVIVDQVAEGDETCDQPPFPCSKDPDQAFCKYYDLIEYVQLDYRLAVGPVFARHLAHRYYRGEYFAMQIDAHVRFVQDWDDDLQWQWESANNEMAVLTSILSDINEAIEPVTFELNNYMRPITCGVEFVGKNDRLHMQLQRPIEVSVMYEQNEVCMSM